MNNHITTVADNLEFATPAMKEKGVAFLVSSWAQSDWDRVGLEIYRRGYVQITKELFRSHLLDELYKLEEADVEIYPDLVADEIAELLDDYWTNEELYAQQLQAWLAQDQQTRIDVGLGAPAIPDTPPPTRRVSPHRRAQADIIATEVAHKSQRMRDLNVQMLDYQRVQGQVIVRLAVTGWSGLKTIFKRDDGILDEMAFITMRREIGEADYNHLSNFIFAQQGIGEEEEGNSDWPANSTAGQTSSPEPKTASAPSAGNSTMSSTEPTRSDESDPTTTGSLNSTSVSTGETGIIDDGQSKEDGEDSPAS